MKINLKNLLKVGVVATGFALGNCSVDGCEISSSNKSFYEIMDKIEDQSVVDDVFDIMHVYTYNHVNCRGDFIDMNDATNYLEKVLNITKMLKEMDIEPLSGDDLNNDDFNYVANWSLDRAYGFVSSCASVDDTLKKMCVPKLRALETVYEQEIKTNGVEIAAYLLEASAKSRFIDLYDTEYLKVRHVCIDDNNLVYNDHKYDDSTGSLELVKKLYEVKYSEDLDSIDYKEIYSLVNDAYDTSMKILNNGVEVENSVLSIK